MSDFNISFSRQQLVVLNNALVEMPFKLASPLINHINSEIQKAIDSASNVGIDSGSVDEESLNGKLSVSAN